MWATAIALLFLAEGYLLVSRWIITRAIAVRSSEHPQYFHAALAGTAIFACASFALAVLTKHLPELSVLVSRLASHEALAIAGKVPAETVARGFAAVVVGFVLAFLWPWLLNRPLKRSSTLTSSILERSGAQTHFERLVVDSMLRLPLMLTQDTGKVYVGFVVGEDARTMDIGEWIRIEPLLSGCRGDDHRFELTTTYEWLHQGVATEQRLAVTGLAKADFDIVIPVGSIKSAHAFDIATYRSMFIAPNDKDEPAPITAAGVAVSSERQAWWRRVLSGRRAQRRAYWLYVVLIFAALPAAAASLVVAGVAAAAAAVLYGLLRAAVLRTN